MKRAMLIIFLLSIMIPTTIAKQKKLPQTRPEFIRLIRQQSNDIAQLQEKLEAAEKTITRLKREYQLLYHLCRKNKIVIPATISKPQVSKNKNFKDSMLLGDIGYVDEAIIVELSPQGICAEIKQPIRWYFHRSRGKQLGPGDLPPQKRIAGADRPPYLNKQKKSPKQKTRKRPLGGIWLPSKYREVAVFLDIDGIDASQIADGIEVEIESPCIITGVASKDTATIFVVEKYAG